MRRVSRVALVAVVLAAAVAATAPALASSNAGLRAIANVRSTWAKGHHADPHFTAGSSYDPASGLGDGARDVYTGMVTVSGRIEGFDHNFASRTSLASARASLARTDLPADAHRAWFTNLQGQCAIEEYRSVDLKKAAQPSAVNIEYTSDSAGTVYTGTVTDATLVLVSPESPGDVSC